MLCRFNKFPPDEVTTIHYPMGSLVAYIGINVLGCTSYYPLLAAYLVASVIAGVLCMLLCKKVLEPAAAKFFSNPKKEEAAAPAPAQNR